MNDADRAGPPQRPRRHAVDMAGVFAHLPNAVFIVDTDARIVEANPAASALIGYTREELLGMFPWEFAVGPSREEILEQTHRLARDEVSAFQRVYRRRDGAELTIDLQLRRSDLGGREVIIVSCRDVTTEKRLEERLRRSEARLSEGQRLTKTGIWELDFETGETDWSAETCRIFGFPPGPPSPHYSAFRERVRPEDRDAVDRGLRESFETGEPRPLKYVFVMPDGTRKHIETISQAVVDGEGRSVKLMGTVMDVTERVLASEALRAAVQLARGQVEALTRTVDALAAESAPDRIAQHVLRTIAAQLDALGCSLWRRSEPDGMVALEFAFEHGELVAPTDSRLAGVNAALRVDAVWPWPEVFRTGKPCLLSDIREEPPFPWRDRLIAMGVISLLIVPMPVAGKVEGVIGIRFGTRRSCSPDELELAQSLANLAMLALQLTRLAVQSRSAAVLAERNRLAREIHDTLAQGFTGVIVQLEAAADATSKQLAREANEHLRRAADLARESLQEARRSVQALRPQALEGRDLAEALANLFHTMTAGTALRAELVIAGAKRALSRELEENLLRIGQEVLTNTLRHARAGHFTARLAFDLRGMELELGDDGRGFDPHGRHDGFGLVGIRERVQSMGGSMDIRSVPGAGTSIRIRLPYTAGGFETNGSA